MNKKHSTVKTILELKDTLDILNTSIDQLLFLRVQLKNKIENLQTINNNDPVEPRTPGINIY